MKNRTHLESLLFVNYIESLVFLESKKFKFICPAGKFHLWLMSSSYLLVELSYLYSNNDSQFFLMIKYFEKYTENFYNYCKELHRDEIYSTCILKTTKFSEDKELNSNLIRANRFFLENEYNFKNFFKNCFDNYTGELSILVDSLQNDDKEITEPNLAFINLFYFPFYYAILKNNN